MAQPKESSENTTKTEAEGAPRNQEEGARGEKTETPERENHDVAEVCRRMFAGDMPDCCTEMMETMRARLADRPEDAKQPHRACCA